MNFYQFKIQWLFRQSEIKPAIKLLGVINLTEIHIRDINLNILYSFKSLHFNKSETNDKDVVKWVDLKFNKDQSCFYIEFVKK